MNYRSKPVTPELNNIYCAYSRMFELELVKSHGATLEIALTDSNDERCEFVTPSQTKPGKPLKLIEQHNAFSMRVLSVQDQQASSASITETNLEPNEDGSSYFSVRIAEQEDFIVCGFDEALASCRRALLEQLNKAH